MNCRLVGKLFFLVFKQIGFYSLINTVLRLKNTRTRNRSRDVSAKRSIFQIINSKTWIVRFQRIDVYSSCKFEFAISVHMFFDVTPAKCLSNDIVQKKKKSRIGFITRTCAEWRRKEKYCKETRVAINNERRV